MPAELLKVVADGLGLAFEWGEKRRHLPGPDRAQLVSIVEETDRSLAEEQGTGLRALVDRLERVMVTPELDREIRRWAATNSAPTLVVHCEDPGAERIPWELLPRALGLPDLFVARLAPAAPAAPALETPAQLLAAVWFGFDSDEVERSLRREINGLSLLEGDRLAVTSLVNVPADALADQVRLHPPALVHLVADAGYPGALLLGARGAIEATDLVRVLTGGPSSPSVVTLNTCFGGRVMAPVLTRGAGCVTVSWAGWISSRPAEAFAAHFYRRVLDGASVVAAVRSFAQRFGVEPGDDAPIPTVWLPAFAATDAPVLPKPAPPKLVATIEFVPGPSLLGSGLHAIASTSGDASAPRAVDAVELELEVVPALSPALLKNGQPIFKQATVTVRRPRRLRLEIVCDAGSGTSVYRTMIAVTPESPVVPLSRVQFPVLYQLIEQPGMRRRYVSFSASVSDGREVLDERTLPSLLLAADEWVDQRDLWPFLSAFVRSQGEGLAELQTEAAELLKDLGSGDDVFDGYQRAAPGVASKQIEALYKKLGRRVTQYTNPLGGRVRVPGASEMAVQLVRSPAEILKTRAGTCHDLALLFASFAERVDLYPLVILVPGHTLFGFWSTKGAYSKYWDARDRDTTRSEAFGGDWMITSPDRLHELVEALDIIVVEATAIARLELASKYKEAIRLASERVAQRTLNVAIDVTRSRRAVQPL